MNKLCFCSLVKAIVVHLVITNGLSSKDQIFRYQALRKKKDVLPGHPGQWSQQPREVSKVSTMVPTLQVEVES